MRRHTTIRASMLAVLCVLSITLAGCGLAHSNALAGPLVSKGSCGKGKIKLTVWTYYAGPGQLGALKNQDKVFEKACPNVTVNQVQVPGAQLDSKLLATASTRSGPDVLLNNVVVDFPELQAAGVMYDLTKAWQAYPQRKLFPDAGIWKAPNGHIYTVMSYTNLIGLYYNKDILDRYHLSPPKNLAEFEAAMKTVTDAGKYKGLAESGAPNVEGAWLWMPLLLSQDVNYCNFSGPKVLKAFQRLEKWAKSGYIPKATATWSQGDAWQQFVTGKYAFGINGNWNLGTAAGTAKFKYGTGRFPTATGKSIVFPGGEGLAIGAYTKHPDVAWKYLETAWLSKSGSIADYASSGQIPVRSDVAETPEVKNNKLVTPFVEAAANTGSWPNNPKTAQMQNALGKAVSGVISGQINAKDAAATAISTVDDARKAGGGGC